MTGHALKPIDTTDGRHIDTMLESFQKIISICRDPLTDLGTLCTVRIGVLRIR